MNDTETTSHSLEEELLESVDIDEGWQLLERFAGLVRESGTADERAAAQYIADRLESLGVAVILHEPELLVSLPRRTEVDVSWTGGRRSIRAKTSSFSLATGDEGRSAELVHLPADRCRAVTDLFDHHLSSQDADLGGKIVLTEGLAMPTTVRLLEKMGAVAQIYIHPGRNIHEGICTTIWGTPTASNIDRKPSTPIACINRPDGDSLLQQLSRGPVQATVRTRLEEGWRKCFLPEVRIEGGIEPERFLLVHGHYDSWHVGIGDNATGDAVLLELARMFHQVRGRLRRSLRIAWWPAHSTGRYAGSAWYADRFALDLRKNCIGQVNIDSPGCRGATTFDEVMWMMECDELCRQAIRDRTGKESRRLRPLRAGDYSFNQIGLSSFFMLLSNRSKEERDRLGFYPVGGCGGDIAWHTEDDLLEIADRDVLRQDLEIYSTALGRALNAPILPFDFRPVAVELREGLQAGTDAGDDSVPLDSAAAELDSLEEEIEAFQRYASTNQALGQQDEVNRLLMELARRLVPVNYARGERFDHDPAESLSVIPKLDKMSRLARLPKDSDEWRFQAAELRRQCNKVANAFFEAAELLRAGRRLLGY